MPITNNKGGLGVSAPRDVIDPTGDEHVTVADPRAPALFGLQGHVTERKMLPAVRRLLVLIELRRLFVDPEFRPKGRRLSDVWADRGSRDCRAVTALEPCHSAKSCSRACCGTCPSVGEVHRDPEPANLRRGSFLVTISDRALLASVERRKRINAEWPKTTL